jgi:hypothetical protein
VGRRSQTETVSGICQAFLQRRTWMLDREHLKQVVALLAAAPNV